MKQQTRWINALMIVALLMAWSGSNAVMAQTPVGAAFTYQGRLMTVSGLCDMSFMLYDEESGGTQIGATQTITDVVMSDGYFSAAPDFGAPSWNGDTRWLQVEATCPPGGSLMEFPRQVVRAVPYAMYALNSGAITSTVYVTSTVYYTPSYHLQGWETITGTPTTLGGYGITDVLKTGAGILTLSSASGLTLTAERDGAVIVRTTTPNIVGDSVGNARGVSAVDLQLGRDGGAPGLSQVASGLYASLYGGFGNTASAVGSTVIGGYNGIASGIGSTVVGGEFGTANGTGATTLGGSYNSVAGAYSVASGRRSKTGMRDGVFLFSDSTDADFNGFTQNEFAIRARGGFRHAWDDSSYWTAQVSSAGAVTLDAVGAASGFNFSDAITLSEGMSVSANKFVSTLTDGSTGGLRAGSGSDVLWYRNITDTWRTPDSVIVDGNVGIGTTDIENWSPYYRAIEFYRSSIMGGKSLVNLISINSNAYYDGAWKYKSSDKAAHYVMYNGDHYFGTAISGTEDAPLTWVNNMMISNIGNVGIGTTTPNNFTLQVAGNIGPDTFNTYDLGSASNYWATIHYHTLTAHSLSVFSTTVTLQNGTEVSCLDALKEIKSDPTKTIKGIPHMDYSTIPSVALNAAPIGEGEDGADLDMMVSLMLCAERELDAKSTTLDNRISDLEKRIADLEQKVK